MQSDNFLIRDAGPRDAPMLAGLIAGAFADVARRFGLTPANCPKHPSNCTAQWVSADLERGVGYFVLEKDGEALGCAALEQADAGRCYLERLAVTPEARRRGLGRALVGHAAARAAEMGASVLGIGIIAAHDDLRRWYLGLGFAEGAVRDFAHLPFRVLFMERAL